MNVDNDTNAWLKTELVGVLGFPEVDDILSYILTSFQAKSEVESYLTELLGIPSSRAQTISARLFKPVKPPVKPISSNKREAKQQGAPLVPKPTTPNSRIKQGKLKNKKASKVLHSRIINCLECGRIEFNGSRQCAFCEAELRYEELDHQEMDPAAQEHMKRLVDYDENSVERTTVVDTEEFFYDQVESSRTGERRGQQPLVVNLDLANRSFTTGTAASTAITQNHDLSKDARDLLHTIQKRVEKEGRNGAHATSSHPALTNAAPLVVDDQYSALYV